MSGQAPVARAYRSILLPAIGLLVASLLASLVGCSRTPSGGMPGGVGTQARKAAEPQEQFVPYDVRPLLKPKRKYLGAAIKDAPQSMTPVNEFATQIGKRPNLLKYYAAWGDQYETQWIRQAWNAGALTLIAWEPFRPSLVQIAKGVSDNYVREFATKVRDLNLPVAISFGHEMNGDWYPWGTENNDPADFVRAWRHVHQIFRDTGATSVIWVWNPNVTNPVPTVRLRPLYPGDAYVDWIGIVGFYSRSGANRFKGLFGPTQKEVRKFTKKPFIITETAAEPGTRKRRDVADLFAGVAAASDVIGLVWFNYHKEDANWRIEEDSAALAEFRRGAASKLFGFDVKDP